MSNPITQACQDIVDLLKAADFAATFVDRIRRAYLPIKDLAGLRPGEVHITVIPPISIENSISSRSGERYEFFAQVVVEGKLISGTQDSEAWNEDCDRFAEVMRDVVVLLRKQTLFAHGATRNGPGRTVYNFSPKSLRQNCWSSAWAIPLAVEESKR